MTFTDLRTDIMDRLNLSSTDASTRIGRAINRVYRKVTSSIGLQLSRRATIQQNVTMGVSTVTFTNTEKVINVVNRAVSPYRFLEEVTLDELQKDMPFGAHDNPVKYAIHSHTSDTVTILIRCVPQTAFTLYADVHQAVSDLSGSNEPAFPESFHDVIIEGVLADEYRKLEKPGMAQIAQKEYDRLLSDLKMWIAKASLELYQGKTSSSLPRGTSGGSGSGSAFDGSQSWTQTGNINFDRGSGVAPFTIDDADAGKVTNLDADKLDGFDESAFAKLADNEVISGNWEFDGTVELDGNIHVDGTAEFEAAVNFDGAVDFDAAAVFDSTVDFNGAVDFAGASLLLPQTAAPAQTAEGSVVWDTNDDLLTVGTGAARKTMVDTDSTQTLTNKTHNGVTVASSALNLTVGQITFPAAQNASANANTLDDYEEGTWTPVLTCATPGNLNVAYSTQTGAYTKIGRQVSLRFHIVTSTFTHTTASGSVSLTGHGFTADNANHIGSMYFGGITKANYTQFVPRSVAANSLDIVCSGSAQTVAVLAITEMPTGGTVSLVGSITFWV